MKAPTIALALAALIALHGGSSTTHALTTKTIEKNCKALKVCYKGGVQNNPCTIAESTCPPCVTFENSGCYELNNTGGCNFGSLCSTYWEEDDTSTSNGSGSATASSKTSGSNEAGNGATAGKNSTTNSTKTASSSSAAGAGAGNAGSLGSDSNSSDMSVIFAIIGAAMGVIAVAIIFLTLVRRSRAAHEDEDDVATPPAAMGKDPVSTTAAVTYASYARGRGTSGAVGGTSGAAGGVPVAEAASNSNVASYYNQQPKDLPIASPRVAGRAAPAAAATAAASTSSVVNYYAQQPKDLPATSPRVAGRAVPASAPRPQPAPAPAARAMPMFANKAPLSNAHQQQYQQEVAYQQQVPVVVQVQEAPRRVSSPRNRRESFEF